MRAQILIAEDESSLRALFQEVLGECFNVVTAVDGAEALDMFRAQSGIQLLLSDIRMPKLGGFALAAEALRLNPEVKVLFMSAYTDEMPPDSVLIGREIRILRKPFGMEKLKGLIEEMLSRP